MKMRMPVPWLVLPFALGLFGCGSGNVGNEGVIQWPDDGNAHVAEGTPITYNTNPPTSGTHYPIAQAGGFYIHTIQLGYLVHTMEHGGIIIYYDPDTVTTEQQDELRTIVQPHLGNFSTVVALPRDDAEFPIILTAWRHWQRLRVYDAAAINGFVTQFLGQGPEN
jgi:hypothetical protein